MYYNGLSNGPLEGINNKIKVIKRISYDYRSFTNFKTKILLVFSLFTPSETNKKPRYSKEERQAILAKKKEIRLKRKNKKKGSDSKIVISEKSILSSHPRKFIRYLKSFY